MSGTNTPLSAKQTLLLILLPMLFIFAALRLYLHLGHVRHIYPGGYLVHHLFLGIVVALPAAFVLAFGVQNRSTNVLVRIALGVGSGMMLDELAYLVATAASDADYVSRVSLLGAIVCISAAAILLLILYALRRD
jgi:hypothetical protein